MRYFLLLFAFTQTLAKAQDTTKQTKFIFSAYTDGYFQYDANKPVNNKRPEGIYNFKRSGKVFCNLALLKATFNNKKWRVNLGIMAGDYSTYNLVAEPGLLKHVYEANIGYSLTEKLSIDAGILPSHIGFEAAIAKDNWNLSRSLLAENSPYYETGIKLNYAFNNKLSASALVLNGWQNIKDYNRSKAFGTQVQYKPNNKWLFNSSTFIGNESQGSTGMLRLFHNLFITYNAGKFKTALLLDAGTEKNQYSKWSNWSGTALLTQYSFSNKFSIASRFEYYNDKKGMIVNAYLPQPFTVTGYAFNTDYYIHKNILLRAEARLLHADKQIFETATLPKNNSFSLLSSIAVFF